MQLAINYSLQALELRNEGRIRFDRFKCADWPDMIADARRHAPVYVHFPLEAGLKTQRNTMPLDDIAAEIVAAVDGVNTASVRVLEKNGFQQVGRGSETGTILFELRRAVFERRRSARRGRGECHSSWALQGRPGRGHGSWPPRSTRRPRLARGPG